jgi:hypothetical protein
MNLRKFSLLIKVLESFLRCQILVLVFKQKLWCVLTRWLAVSGIWTLVFFFSCCSVWSAPPPARWSNSVLNAALCPWDQFWDPPPALTWEVSLSLHSLSQPLCLSWSLVGADTSSRRMAYWPAPAHSLCCFMAHLRVWHQRAPFLVTPLDSSAVTDWLFVPPLFSRAGSAFSPHLWCWC